MNEIISVIALGSMVVVGAGATLVGLWAGANIDWDKQTERKEEKPAPPKEEKKSWTEMLAPKRKPKQKFSDVCVIDLDLPDEVPEVGEAEDAVMFKDIEDMEHLALEAAQKEADLIHAHKTSLHENRLGELAIDVEVVKRVPKQVWHVCEICRKRAKNEPALNGKHYCSKCSPDEVK